MKEFRIPPADPDFSLEELVAKAQKGDAAAYRLFLKEIYPYVKSAMRSKLRGLVDQEDLTQECLVGIHRNLGTYQVGKPVKPWVSAIIRYKLADHFRKISRKKEHVYTKLQFDVTQVPDETNDYDEANQQDAQEILERIPGKLKRAIELTHIKGLSYSDAADQEGISEVALRKRISRGFSKIRKVVAKEMEI